MGAQTSKLAEEDNESFEELDGSECVDSDEYQRPGATSYYLSSSDSDADLADCDLHRKSIQPFRLNTGSSSGGTITPLSESLESDITSDTIDGPVLLPDLQLQKDTSDVQQQICSSSGNSSEVFQPVNNHTPNLEEVDVLKNSSKKAVQEKSLELFGIFDVTFAGISSFGPYTPPTSGNSDDTSSSSDKDLLSQNDRLNIPPRDDSENNIQQEEVLGSKIPAFSDVIQGTSSDLCRNSPQDFRSGCVEVVQETFTELSCSNDVAEGFSHPQKKQTCTPQNGLVTNGDELHTDNESVSVVSYTVSFGGMHSFILESGSQEVVHKETQVGGNTLLHHSVNHDS